MSRRFVQVDAELAALGLPSRLLVLYARLRLYAGNDGRVNPKHSTLAREIGLRSRRQVINLLDSLQRLRLIEWTRGRQFNTYRVLDPDVKWISHQMCNGFHISDVKRSSHRKEWPVEKISRKESVVQPASVTVSEAGGLNELLTGIWQHLPGSPGGKLLEQIATVLGDAPVEQFRALLISRRRIARSFGLALELAAESRKRWDADAAAHKQAAEAELQDKIRRAEGFLADDRTPPEELPDLERYLGELRQQLDTIQASAPARRNPDSETKPPAEGKGAA